MAVPCRPRWQFLNPPLQFLQPAVAVPKARSCSSRYSSVMSLLVTDAIVLHVADYLESSRLLRLATREAGVQSVVARGARNSRKRFGTAIDLFAEGHARIEMRPGRDLHTLIGFDVTRSNPGLAQALTRFSAASALAECALRVVHDEAAPVVFDVLRDAFDKLGACADEQASALTIGALWRVVRETGFAPTVDECANCHEPADPAADAPFSHAIGGVLCARCAARSPGGRRLPADARGALRRWMADQPVELSAAEVRSHQRLLREFLVQYLTDGRPLRAFSAWEAGGLNH